MHSVYYLTPFHLSPTHAGLSFVMAGDTLHSTSCKTLHTKNSTHTNSEEWCAPLTPPKSTATGICLTYLFHFRLSVIRLTVRWWMSTSSSLAHTVRARHSHSTIPWQQQLGWIEFCFSIVSRKIPSFCLCTIDRRSKAGLRSIPSSLCCEEHFHW